ncbi:MAG: hypothetical protein R3190_04165 [Thermoanaerobaculia bacterium]|nr:hypothetical protein [Thermoanaerobaculia bacterium]
MCGSARLVVAATWDGRPIPAPERVRIDLDWNTERLRIGVDAPFHSDPPPPAPAGSTDRLWEHEVVEVFLASDTDPHRYTEIELGPWGHYLVLRFSGPRRRVGGHRPLEFEASRTADRWSGTALLDADELPPRPWRGNAYAIHGQGDARRYLAVHRTPGPHPDFHQPAFFPRLEAR